MWRIPFFPSPFSLPFPIRVLGRVNERMEPLGDLRVGPSSPPPCPWNVGPTHSSYTQSYSEDAALREEGVVKTTWTKYVTEPSLGLYVNF